MTKYQVTKLKRLVSADSFQKISGYDSALARNTDPVTSHSAAHSLDHITLSRLQGLVYELLKANPNGLTVPEIAEKANIPRDTISPRMKALVKMNLVYDMGETRVPAGHKRACIIWSTR